MIKFALVGAFLVMLSLKLAGIATVSWWLVVLPLLVPLIMVLVFGALVGTVATVAAGLAKHKRK